MVRRASCAQAAQQRATTDRVARALPGKQMPRIDDPAPIDHSDLRELAVQAAWVAKLEHAVGVLEELVSTSSMRNSVQSWSRGKKIHSRWRCQSCTPTTKQPTKNSRRE